VTADLTGTCQLAVLGPLLANHLKLTIVLHFADFQFTAYGKIGRLTIS
jgi:hypothetical protein